MKNYTNIPHQFFHEATGRKIRRMGAVAIAISNYLMVNKSVNTIGIYHAPYCLIAHMVGIKEERVKRIISKLIAIGFCKYDEKSDYVWVCDLVNFEVSKPLHPRDNRVTHVNNLYAALPEIAFLQDFYDKYSTKLQLKKARENHIATDMPCEDSCSQASNTLHVTIYN